ncbi:hypothetical protein [Candidatus Nitrospira salsa]
MAYNETARKTQEDFCSSGKGVLSSAERAVKIQETSSANLPDHAAKALTHYMPWLIEQPQLASCK